MAEHWSQAEIEAAFEEEFARIVEEERERERRGEPPPPPRPLEPHVAEAAAALNEMFGDGYHLTADLSFDQVYAKVLPHFITIMKHMARERPELRDLIERQTPAEGDG